MTQQKSGRPTHQIDRAANTPITASESRATDRQFPWPATPLLGTVPPSRVVEMRDENFCALCGSWRVGTHPDHVVVVDRVAEALAYHQRRRADRRAVRAELDERRRHGLESRHAAKLRR